MADSLEAGHVEEMGLGKRMVGVFVAPRATFESVRSCVNTSDWLLPMITMAIPFPVGLAWSGLINVSSAAEAFIVLLLFMFLLPALLLVFVRFVLRGETTYKHVLAVYYLSSLAWVSVAFVWLSIFSVEVNTFWARLLIIFSMGSYIWACVGMCIGLGIVSDISTQKALMGIFGAYLLVFLLLYLLGYA